MKLPRPSRRYQQILRAILAGLVSKGTNLLVGLLLVPLTLRYLGAERYGLWITIAGSVNLFVLLDIGIANTLTNLISEAYADDDRSRASEYFASAFWMVSTVSLVMGCVALLLWPHLNWPAIFHPTSSTATAEISSAVAVAAVILLLSLPAGLMPRVLAGYQELHRANYFTAAGSVLSLCSVLVAMHRHAGLPALVGCYAGSVVASNLAGLVWLVLFHKPWLLPNPRLVRRVHTHRILRTGGQFFVIQLAGLIVMNSDNLVLSHYLSPAAVTPYNTTWRLVGYVLALQGLPIAAMWPAIAEARARNDLPWIRGAYRRMRMITLAVLAVACGVMLPFGKFIVLHWAGPSAVPSTHLLVLMCVWMCISAITVYQSNLMGAVSRLSRQALSSALAAAVNLGLSLVWVRSMGQEGVLLATVTSYLVFVVLVQLYEVHQILGGVADKPQRDQPGMKQRGIRLVRKVLRSLVPLAHVLPIGRSRLSAEKADRLQRILLLHPGHIGDLVIATAMLEPLRQRFPGVRFGFAVGSGSAAVLQGLPEVQAVHIIDHWRLNRGNLSIVAKWKHYAKTRAKAIASIRADQYDCAICLLNEDPDLLDIVWRADVPMRVGFRHSYFAPLATHTVVDNDIHANQMVRQAQTLRAFGIAEDVALHAELAPDTSEAVQHVRSIVGDRPYRIIHMGAGHALKEMPEDFWRTIAQKLAPTHTLVFTGRGEREQAMAERVAADLPNAVIACNRLSWAEFVAAIRKAEMLYGVDSMAGHVAAAVNTQSALAYSGLNSVVRWRPYSALATVFTVPEPCAPCHLPHGCPSMPCKNISPLDLLAVQVLTA